VVTPAFGFDDGEQLPPEHPRLRRQARTLRR
jgi:hypothetical protein